MGYRMGIKKGYELPKLVTVLKTTL